MAKVSVRPVPDSKPWHGKEGKESFKRPHAIKALYDSSTGGYAVDLTSEEVKEYSKKLGVDLTPTFRADEPHPFYDSTNGTIKLLNQTMFFEDTKPLDFIKIKILKGSKYVANSLKEYQEGLFPDATHIIYDENEEVKAKATKIQLKNKCIAVAMKLSSDEKINLVQILANKSLKGRSNDFLDVEINNIIENMPDEFLRYAKMDKEEVNIRATILQAISRDILIKEGLSIHYMGEKLANSYEDAVDFFKNPQNGEMKVRILEKLNT